MKTIGSCLGLFVLLAASPAAGAKARAAGDGFWHTSGSQILDASGNVIHFSGLNWSGFETGNYVLHGLWSNVDGQGHSRSLASYLDQIKTLGFNLIRLPFSGDFCASGRMPASGTIDFTANPDLQGKTSLQVLDLFIQDCATRGIRVILDYHRMQAGSASENGLWYIPGDPTYTEQFWITNWQMMANRYQGNTTIVGVDLFNEPHATTWDADGVNPSTNWKDAARRCATAIQAIAPDWLICVQGVGQYNGQAGWWGAVHLGFVDHPLSLSVAQKLVLEIHDYGRDVSDQPWFHAANFPANLEADCWNKFWEFISTQNLAPIWVGEWGSKDDPGDPLYALDHPWLQAFHDFIKAKQYSWTWWTWSPLSADTGGILNADFTTVNQSKMSLIQDVLYPGFAASSGGGGGAPGPTPFGGTAASIPGTVQAEAFDLGGEGVAYHTGTTNQGGQYRPAEGVGIELCSDTGGGYDVGWTAAGDWMIYTVDVSTAGTYSIQIRASSGTAGGTLHFEVGGTNVSGTITVPGTGGWQTWTTVTAPNVVLAAGAQQMKLVEESGGYNLNYFTLALTQASGGSGGGSGTGGSQTPASGSGSGSGGGSSHCGVTGIEVILFLGLAKLRRAGRRGRPVG
jgi:endoglucanase